MENAVAIIGLDCKFPGANNKEEYWELLKKGSDVLSKQDKSTVDGNLNYGRLEDIDQFDAEFFNMNPKDAAYLDPQQRLFLESAWKAVEDAGYKVSTLTQVGIFAGAGVNSYLMSCIIPSIIADQKEYEKLYAQIVHGNSNDYLTSRVSYQLNLTGPSITVQTACSSALTAVHLACRSLLMYECDYAISGGVSVNALQNKGYTYTRGEVNSRTGTCSPFSEDSDGTVFSGGVGTVILKRYEEAVEDRDYIYGIIRSSAVGCDGADKVSYMAPNVTGQERVIKLAIDLAEIDARTIQYIEAHGTGTNIGDKIEIEALKRVFPSDMECMIGSVKGNIGHALAAAGIAGLIKTVLCLERGYLCPSINCDKELPKLKDSQFTLNRRFQPWLSTGKPRRAGVSSFGMGGVNAHVILEEENRKRDPPESVDRYKYLRLSARCKESLQKLIDSLVLFIDSNDMTEEELEFAFENREVFQTRRLFYYQSKKELVEQLRNWDAYSVELEPFKEIVLKGSLEYNPFYQRLRAQFNTISTSECEAGVDKVLTVETEGAFAELMKALWEKGRDFSLDLKQLNRLPAPTYEFKKVRHWIDSNLSGPDLKTPAIKERVTDYETLKGYIADKWEKFLGFQVMDITANFFEIGGNSLLAIQIINEIEEDKGILLPMEEMLLEPTIVTMSGIVKNCLKNREDEDKRDDFDNVSTT